MRRLLFLFFSLLLLCGVASAQTTAVTLQVTDSGSQTWNNGSWATTLASPPGQVPAGPPFYGAGTNVAVPNQSQSGTLSGTGSATMTLTQNVGITPTNSRWNFTVCATTTATNNCYTQLVVITATTSVTLAPPALIVNAGPNALAYVAAEVVGTQIGAQFYSLATASSQVCIALPCSGANWVAGGGGSSNSTAASFYTTGLIGLYEFLPGETVATLPDHSGKGNNATGTVGTAPTIAANGGLNCPGNGGVVLPAGLNSTVVTMIAFVNYQPSGLSSGFYSPILGNGTPATSGVGPVIQQSSTLSNSVGSFSNNFGGGNALYDVGYSYIAGIQDIALVLSNSADVMYNNGFVTQKSQTGAALGAQTTGVYSICGAAAGSGNTGQSYMPSGSQVLLVMLYSGALTAAQVFQNHIAGLNFLQGEGINPLPYRNDTGNVIMSFGDSTTVGSGFIPWTSRAVGLNSGASWNIINKGITGVNAAFLQANAIQTVDSTCSTSGGLTSYVLLTGANDSVPQTVFGNARGFVQERAYPFCSKPITILSTMMDKSDSGTGDTLKNGVNALIRSYCSTTATYCVDLGETVALGANLASGVASYFQGDFLHPTQAGADVLTWVFQRAINRVFGNHDFTTANTYTSVAITPVAVTAATYASNVMTFTTAAQTFQPGQCIVVAGTTSNGSTTTAYNSTFANSAGLGCWYALTTSATSFTAWTQLTSGVVGTLTVAGTATTPEQVDADQVVILNFGAGSFTLEPCDGLTVNDVTIIKDVNAVGSTITPFGSQTINGVGTYSLAAGATVRLQPQLVSAAAGGCNWLTQ